AHLAAGLRAEHRRDRTGVPGARAHHGGAGDPREEEDLSCPDRLPGARRSRAAGPARRGPDCGAPAVYHRAYGSGGGRTGPRRPGGTRHRPGPHAQRPDARRARGARAARPAAAHRRAPGRLLLLEQQDRSLWDAAAIREGAGLVVSALRGGRPGRFALQGAIAAVHAEAPSYAGTDWPQLLRLYDELLRAWPSPVVALNRAVVLAMVSGPAAALAEIAGLERDGRLAGYRYLPAAKADLLRRLGRRPDAGHAYHEALDLTENAAERAFLSRRIAEVCGGADLRPGA